MTNPSFFKRGLAIASLALALAACSSGEVPAGHSSADRNEGHTKSSSGLPAGNIAAGEKFANTKRPPTNQACVECHGTNSDSKLPIDPVTPRLAGQYHDYLAHSLQMYRDGDRAHALMSLQAKDLTDQQIADVTAYFGSLQNDKLRDLHGVH
ncbi:MULTISPECIES: c-type cytochrome [Lysobacter]|jgi:cytochrome c553|uniref:Cytochrome c4 n=1 Tax=Lysobacter capsici AZ78 TaxID=1444315 RepID=A0A108U658_9GAMM|nr:MULTISPECIES: c-type cytochrome [Lysobacter]ALN85563.1 cytochrome c-552 domain protein [Lysobacter capsici]ATE71688.1 cytochrome C biogenesis protein CcsA [Lysobacter capsici]KRB08562.1 hypothetical protein ASD86_04310 [Lysobacter sp. Root690]KWS03285.1 Cytochrome c4 [Lysobacter capsici AZ78]UOF17003.1 c-type cytochrome [Lysobacter capsici]